MYKYDVTNGELSSVKCTYISFFSLPKGPFIDVLYTCERMIIEKQE